MKDIRLHDLRRTHATILMQGNIDPRPITGRLGHSGTAMLAKHYAVDLGDIEAAKAFSALLQDSEPQQADDSGETPYEIGAVSRNEAAPPGVFD